MSSNASSKDPIRVPPEKRGALYRLTNPPAIAWPTVGVLAFILTGVLGTDILSVMGYLPLGAASLVNVVFMYPVFHVVHDATHRSASANVRLNDWIGRIGLLPIAPFVSLSTFRYSHMIHHRFTNGPKDPDHYAHGPWWNIALRWMTFDLSYVYYNLRSGDPRGIQTLKDTLPLAALTVLTIAVLVGKGYGSEVLFLWFIPARITTMLIGFVFLWLPHLGDANTGQVVHLNDDTAGSGLTTGTTMRLGHEGVLDYLMQWHNYHLIHHLWPTTPSYQHSAVWRLMEPELRARDLRIQHGWALASVLEPGQSVQVNQGANL